MEEQVARQKFTQQHYYKLVGVGVFARLKGFFWIPQGEVSVEN
jgi:hypothetical protein